MYIIFVVVYVFVPFSKFRIFLRIFSIVNILLHIKYIVDVFIIYVRSLEIPTAFSIIDVLSIQV